MNTSDPSFGSLYQSGPSREMNAADAAKMKDIEDVKSQSIDHALWTSAQSLALAKLKVFHSMAKSVNEQQ